MTAATTIEIQYSCHGCGLDKVGVNVRARGPAEDLMAWLDALRIEVTRDHRTRRPFCAADACDLRIPLAGRDRIGGPAIQ